MRVVYLLCQERWFVEDARCYVADAAIAASAAFPYVVRLWCIVLSWTPRLLHGPHFVHHTSRPMLYEYLPPILRQTSVQPIQYINIYIYSLLSSYCCHVLPHPRLTCVVLVHPALSLFPSSLPPNPLTSFSCLWWHSACCNTLDQQPPTSVLLPPPATQPTFVVSLFQNHLLAFSSYFVVCHTFQFPPICEQQQQQLVVLASASIMRCWCSTQ